jgi:chemotaxis protein MotC
MSFQAQIRVMIHCICLVALSSVAQPSSANSSDDQRVFRMMRAVAVLGEQITRGDEEAFSKVRSLRQKTDKALKRVSADVWAHERNRSQLLRYVATGGAPGILNRLLLYGVFAKEEFNLATGVFAYSTGRVDIARRQLASVEFDQLRPSLQSVMLLVRGILVAGQDLAAAREFFAKARLLAPGTRIEETALRMVASAEAFAGRVPEFVKGLDHYTRRFPRSLFFDAILQPAAAVIGRMHPDQTAEFRTVGSAVARLPGRGRIPLIVTATVEALRHGNLGIAEKLLATLKSEDQLPERIAQQLDVFAVASRVFTPKTSSEMTNMMGGLERATLPPEERQLFVAVQNIRKFIFASEAHPEPAQGADEKTHALKDQSAAESDADKIVLETNARVSAALERIATIEEEINP